MTNPQDPGNPDNTDPEATSADAAEAAAQEAHDAQAGGAADAPEADSAASAETDNAGNAANNGTAGTAGADGTEGLDPTLEADVEAALADVASDGDAEQAEAAADAQADLAAEDPQASLQAQLAERTEDLQRLNAEYTNYRRRTERERQSVIDNAKSQVLSQFLPVIDDLELARQHGDLDEGPLKSIADKLDATLKKQKVEPFGTEGEPFDPEIHEAIQDLSTGDEQYVGTVLRRGYRIGDKLIRTAMVIIADAADGTDADAGADGAAN